MKKRGRKSAAELAVIGSGGIEMVRRPDAPAELSDYQSERWRRIVNAHPADWFSMGAQPVLAQLCRHMDAAHKLAQVVRQFEQGEEFDLDGWLAVLRAQDRESGRIAQLATKCG